VATSNQDTRVALDAITAVIAEHKALGVQAKAIEERRKELGARILEAIGESVEGTVGGVVAVKVPFRTNSNIDAKIVKELAPDIHAEALRLVAYRPVLHQG
jgi:predicted phage-related endonuclease